HPALERQPPCQHRMEVDRQKCLDSLAFARITRERLAGGGWGFSTAQESFTGRARPSPRVKGVDQVWSEGGGKKTASRRPSQARFASSISHEVMQTSCARISSSIIARGSTWNEAWSSRLA